MKAGDRKIIRPNSVFLDRNKDGEEYIVGVFKGEEEGETDSRWWGYATEENIQALIDAGVIGSKDDLKPKSEKE